MHQGKWKCSKCGGIITELPFEPRSELGLTCRTCYSKQKKGGEKNTFDLPVASEATDLPPEHAILAGEPAPTDDFGMDTLPITSERPKFSGDWKCANCETSIKSLPFQPRDTSNLKCIDCFKRSKE